MQMKKIKTLNIVIIMFVLVAFTSCKSPVKEDVTEDNIPITETKSEEQPEKEQSAMEKFKSETKVYASGKYIVNEQIDPGLYLIIGNGHWARLSNLDVNPDNTIAEKDTVNREYVEIAKTDKGFYLQAATAYKVTDAMPQEKAMEFVDGMYIVGKDIQAGTYECKGIKDAFGWWGIFLNASGDGNAIVTGQVDSEEIVTIALEDGNIVESQYCGKWAKVK